MFHILVFNQIILEYSRFTMLCYFLYSNVNHYTCTYIYSTLDLLPFRSPGWRGRWHPTPVLLLGKSHGRRSVVGCSPWGREESDTTEQLHFHFSLSCIGEGNGNPLQCSCLENPRDGEAWWAAVYGVAQSPWLKRLSSSSRSPGNFEWSSLRYPIGSCWLSILYIESIVYVFPFLLFVITFIASVTFLVLWRQQLGLSSTLWWILHIYSVFGMC